ncbi:MAG: UDP-forming cellulose synthase catalytic subunit [Nitrosospira sp.]|nr:UDP-forming cellulose synthase catalytic subunit [Nitrosospira sp.]
MTLTPTRIPLHELQKWLPLAFIAVLLYLVLFAQNYLDATQQAITGWGCLFLMMAFYKLRIFQRPPWRLVFMLLAGFLAIRYFSWRSLQTLIYTGPLDFLGMALLYLAEAYGLILLFCGMFVNLWPLTGRPTILPKDATDLPTVDVLIPTYNESDDIIRITVIAATQMEYPKDRLRIHICDDGGTLSKRAQPESAEAAWNRHLRLRQMAKELGVNYITRETNAHAKAGNVNHALNHTDGELFLVLDCDHVPTTNMLQRTVGYFLADPKLFLVQTPHFFINPTPVEKNLVGIGNPNGENDMFYRTIHPALDFWNASYFCGSAAVLRRSHVMGIGGISGKTITEDAETAFQLHGKGYNSIYVEQPMVCGLSPESYDDYVLQRTRWAQGMLQMFIMNNPLFAPGLSWPQRICYFNSCFFWFFGLARFFYFIAPALFLLLGLKIYHASGGQVVAYILPYVLSVMFLMDFLYSKARQPFFSEIYESVQAMFLIPAVISVIINPHKPTFKVTPKGQTHANISLNPLAITFFIIVVINTIALVMAVYKWFDYPLLREVTLVTGGWCLYNFYLAMVTLGAFWERKQIRHFHRINVSGEIEVTFPRLNYTTKADLTDISLTGIGFKVQVPYPLVPQERIFIDARHSDAFDMRGQSFHFEGKIMRLFPQKEESGYACGSELLLNREKYIEAVNYVYGDSERWLELWDKKSTSKGVSKMLWYFFVTGLKGTARSAVMLPAQLLTPALKLLQEVSSHLLSNLRKINFYSLFGQHMEELQVDTERGLLLVRNTFREAQENRRKIPRIGRSSTKALLETNAEMGIKGAQPSGDILNRRKLPRIVPRDAARSTAGISTEFGKITNRRRIPRIGRSLAAEAGMNAKSAQPSGNMLNRRKIPRIVPTDAAKTAANAITGISIKLGNMVNRRKIPRIGPKPTVEVAAKADAKNAAKLDKKTKT